MPEIKEYTCEACKSSFYSSHPQILNLEQQVELMRTNPNIKFHESNDIRYCDKWCEKNGR